MADLALDTSVSPYDDVQLAQAPPVEEPAPPPLPLAPPPAPLAPPPRALDPQATPMQEGVAPPPAPRRGPPAPPPGMPTYVDRPEEEDKLDFQAARNAEQEIVKNTVLGPDGRPITAPNVITDYRTLPKWQELQRLRELYPQMAPKERADTDRQIKLEEQRLINDTNFRNRQAQQQYEQKHREELKLADTPKEDMKAIAETTGMVDQARQAVDAELKKQLESTKPQDKHEADYTIKVTPLGTMKPAEFSEAAAKLGTYNKISARQAVNYAIILGSPVNRDPNTGELQPGANTKNGKPVGPDNPGIVGRGATAFRVLGRVGTDHMLLEMPDKVKIRVPITTYNQFIKVRDEGYKQDKAWWAARRKGFEDAQKDDWVTRQVKSVKGAVEERLNR